MNVVEKTIKIFNKFEIGTIDWLDFEMSHGPICLVSYRGNSSRYCEKFLIELNLYYDDLTAMGYRIFGFSTQETSLCTTLQESLLLRYDLFSTRDIKFKEYLQDKLSVNISTYPYGDGGFRYHPCVIFMKDAKVVYSWTYNPQLSQYSKKRNYPKLLSIFNLLKYGSTEVYEPTPQSKNVPFMLCRLNLEEDFEDIKGTAKSCMTS